MGAFCVFGVSRSACLTSAQRRTPERDPKTLRAYSIGEWALLRDAMAEKLFNETTRLTKISPELDAPQFCRDWLAIDPDNVRGAIIMVRGPKMDKNGNPVKRNGVVVEIWLEYEAECARRNIRAGI